MSNRERERNIKQFDGKDYQNWRFRMQLLLRKEGVFTYVTDQIPSARNQTDVWKREDVRTMELIASHVADKYLDIITSKNHAKEMWDAIATTFERKTDLRVLDFRNELFAMRYKIGTESLADYVMRFRKIVNHLRDHNDQTSSKQYILQLVRSLPSEFMQIRLALEMKDELSWDEATSSILDFGPSVVDKSSDNVDNKLDSKPNTNNMSAPASTSGEIQKAFIADANVNKHRDKQSYSGAYRSNRQGAKKVQCYHCRRFGHLRKNCWKLSNNSNRSRPKQFNQSKQESNQGHLSEIANHDQRFSFLSELQHNIVANVVEMDVISGPIDSGATAHMVNEADSLINVSEVNGVSIGIAKSGERMNAVKVGSLNVTTDQNHDGILNDVYYIPELRRNLFSVRQMDKAGYEVLFGNDEVKIMKDGTIIATGEVKNDLYYIQFRVSKESGCANYSFGSVSDDNYALWHRRLCHLGNTGMKYLINAGLLGEGITRDKSKFCDTCALSKQTKLPHFSNRYGPISSDQTLFRIHSDVCKMGDNQYFVTFIDDYSRFITVYFINNKSEVFEKFKIFEAAVTNQFNRRINRLRVDNGGEYSSKEFQQFCEEKGIFMEYTVPYNPQQNGVSERTNRTLCERARCLLQESGLSETFWREAIACAVYAKNRSPITNSAIPANLWYNKVDYSKMKVFGCSAFVHIPEAKQAGKLQARSVKCVFVGYAPNGYIFWNPVDRKFINSRDVSFNENEMFAKCKRDEITPTIVSTPETVFTNENITPTERDVTPTLATVRPVRERKLPTKFKDYELDAMIAEFSNDMPKTYEEAIQSEDANLWQQAMDRELNHIRSNNVWSMVDRVNGTNIIDTKWVFTYKYDPVNGNVTHKARIVAKGFMQRKNTDYNEIFSPVVKLDTIRLLLSMACVNAWKVIQLDVNCAFLNSELKETIFVNQPDGVELPPGKILRLNKALYGLKQSALSWNNCLSEYLESLNFARCKSDYCVFVYNQDDHIVIIVVYVDDLLITGSSEELINRIRLMLISRFSMKDIGDIRYFLGLNVTYDRINRRMSIDQKSAIVKILEKFEMSDCKGASTPIEKNLKLEKCESDDKITSNPFRELLGSLMYIMLGSRPDLCYSISFFSRFQSKPTDNHFCYLKRVLRYLKQTLDYKLHFVYNVDEPPLKAFADADFANDSDRRSITGGAIFVFGNLVSWKSKKQSLVSLSSTAAEYIALTEVSCHALALRNILIELGVDMNKPFCIYEDNQSCIRLSTDFKNNSRCKYLDVKYAFLHEQISKFKTIILEYLRSSEMIADVCTKSLEKVQFEKCRERMNVRII